MKSKKKSSYLFHSIFDLDRIRVRNQKRAKKKRTMAKAAEPSIEIQTLALLKTMPLDCVPTIVQLKDYFDERNSVQILSRPDVCLQSDAFPRWIYLDAVRQTIGRGIHLDRGREIIVNFILEFLVHFKCLQFNKTIRFIHRAYGDDPTSCPLNACKKHFTHIKRMYWGMHYPERLVLSANEFVVLDVKNFSNFDSKWFGADVDYVLEQLTRSKVFYIVLK